MIKFEVPPDVYVRMCEMIVAGGKWPATGEAGLHSASQLLLLLGEQARPQLEELRNPKKKSNGVDHGGPGPDHADSRDNPS